MNKLLAWLRDWPKYHLGEAGKQKKGVLRYFCSAFALPMPLSLLWVLLMD